jgi:hypothetical protein
LCQSEPHATSQNTVSAVTATDLAGKTEEERRGEERRGEERGTDLALTTSQIVCMRRRRET